MSDNGTELPNDIVDRIRLAGDDRMRVHAAIRAGSDDVSDYYIVVTTNVHDGRKMLNIRYFRAGTVQQAEDTWMRNGINCRHVDGLERALAEALIHVETATDTDSPQLADLTDVGK